MNNVFAAGQQPLMNFKFAPDFMWSCYPNSVGASANQTQGTGAVVDPTFLTYAQYMARIVSYYNTGAMTTETGATITNPAGTRHRIIWWELWNEPDLNNETPCAPSTGNGLTYQQYATMWNAVTAAMLAVDPDLKFAGPATAGAQFGSSASTGNQYVDYLMANAAVKPSALSFHGYGYWDNSVTDTWIFDGDNTEPAAHCCGGVTDLRTGVQRLRGSYPTLPVWLTEVNVNADWGTDARKRPWREFAAAWWGAMFAAVGPQGAGIIHLYDLADGPQFGLFDESADKTYMAYHVFQLLNAAFPPGTTLLSSSSSQADIVSLAGRKPDGTISVMVVNRQLASTSVKSGCGAGGVAADVTVTVQGVGSGTGTIQQLDKTNVNCSTDAASAPTVRSVDVSQGIALSFPGYGLAIVSIPSNGTPPPPATPTPTKTPVPATAPCVPRPEVRVNVTSTVAGRLDVTVSAGVGNGTPANQLRALRFGASTNGRILFGGREVPQNTRIPLSGTIVQAQFSVQRLVSGAAVTVPYEVEDDRDVWPTFVGGGTYAF